MKYSNFHKDKNPFSPARLDEAFKASKMEGGPGDDKVKVTIDKDHEKGEVTVTKQSGGGGSKPLSPEEKVAANDRWSKMSEEDKQAARDRKALKSFTYKKLPYDDSSEMKPIEQDDISFDFPSEVEDDVEDKSTGGYQVRVGGQDRPNKRGEKKKKWPKIKSKPPGNFPTKSSVSCPRF